MTEASRPPTLPLRHLVLNVLFCVVVIATVGYMVVVAIRAVPLLLWAALGFWGLVSLFANDEPPIELRLR